MKTSKGFFAYPSSPLDLSSSIERAVKNLNRNSSIAKYKTWKESNVNGKFIINAIKQEILSCDIFAADISTLNFNVTYEIGYAIGLKKRVILTINSEFFNEREEFNRLGLFDTIGYMNYTNSHELAGHLQDVADMTPLYKHPIRPNKKAPVFILGAQYKSDIISHLFSRIKKALLLFRSFDPNEQMRISCDDAIRQVAQSYGLAIPLLSPNLDGAKLHNLRAAFLAGLGHAMNKIVMLLQSGDSPIPLDYRDFVKTFKFPSQIDLHVHTFAVEVNNAIHEKHKRVSYQNRKFLLNLDLGASSAENELSSFNSSDSFWEGVAGGNRIGSTSDRVELRNHPLSVWRNRCGCSTV